jgi:hypothetical protein
MTTKNSTKCGIAFMGSNSNVGSLNILGGYQGYSSSGYNDGLHNQKGQFISSKIYTSTDGITWTDVGTLPAGSGTGASTGWYNTQSPWMSSTIIGGFNNKESYDVPTYSYSTYLPDYGSVYSTYTGTPWTTRTTTAVWSSRYGHSVVYYNSQLILMGGYDKDSLFKKDVWYSSDEGTTWNQYSDAGWNIRQYPQAQIFNNKIYIFGGYSSASGYYNDVWHGELNTTAITPGSTTTGGAGIQYPPHNVQFLIRDMAGNPIQNANMTVTPVETSMGSYDWLQKLFGIDTAVNIAGSTLMANTGSDGVTSFIMTESIRYNITINQTDGTFNSFLIYPKDDTFILRVGTTALPVPTPGIGKYVTWDLDAVYLNNTYIFLNMSYINSAATTNLTYTVLKDGVSVYTSSPTFVGTSNLSYGFLVGHSDSNYTYGFTAFTPGFGWTNKSQIFVDREKVDIGVDDSWLNTISIFLMLMVGAMFSRRSIRNGVIIVPLFGMLLHQMGWFNFPVVGNTMIVLGALLSIGVLYYIRSAERGI